MLEICVDRIDSVRAAHDGGAHRIELCSALCDGGLTPTTGFMEVVKREFPTMQVFAMLRPRGGNDFAYTQSEMDCVMSDLRYLRTAGADGFVFGALNPDRTIDLKSCQRVVAAAGSLPVTFHRAFDLTDPKDLIENVKLIESLGFKRLLTSGLVPNAVDGLDNIKKIRSAASSLIVMPGAGINVKNAGQILSESGCLEFHSSGRNTSSSKDDGIHGIDFGRSQISDHKTVRILVNIGKASNATH